jgi:hypothetical protein
MAYCHYLVNDRMARLSDSVSLVFQAGFTWVHFVFHLSFYFAGPPLDLYEILLVLTWVLINIIHVFPLCFSRILLGFHLCFDRVVLVFWFWFSMAWPVLSVGDNYVNAIRAAYLLLCEVAVAVSAYVCLSVCPSVYLSVCLSVCHFCLSVTSACHFCCI